MSAEESEATILSRLGLIARLPSAAAELYQTETRRQWEHDARQRLRAIRTKEGRPSKLGAALLRPRSIDRRFRFEPAPPWGGRLRMSAWANRATRGAFELVDTTRERIYRRWADRLGVWRERP